MNLEKIKDTHRKSKIGSGRESPEQQPRVASLGSNNDPKYSIEELLKIYQPDYALPPLDLNNGYSGAINSKSNSRTYRQSLNSSIDSQKKKIKTDYCKMIGKEAKYRSKKTFHIKSHDFAKDNA